MKRLLAFALAVCLAAGANAETFGDFITQQPSATASPNDLVPLVRPSSTTGGATKRTTIQAFFSALSNMIPLGALSTQATGTTLCNVSGAVAVPTACTTGTFHVSTNAALAALPTTSYPNGVWRDDYAVGNGASPLFFMPQTGTCVANSMVNDGGSCVNSAAGNSWKANLDPAGADVRQWGAKPDAVPGAIGAACTGITGTDNIAAFNAATLWAINNHHTLVIGGTGIYRLNSRWDIRTDLTWINFQPFNTNTLRHPSVIVKAPIVTCGTDVGVYINSVGYDGLHVELASLTGPGAGSSLPTPFGGAENIGVLIEGSGSTLRANFTTDYTLGIVLQNGFSNKLYLGNIQGTWQAMTLRDGSGGSAFSTQANEIHYQAIGGAYFVNTDADPGKAFRISRGCNVGIRTTGSGSSNHFHGGTVEYCSKGTSPRNIYNSQNDNEFHTWVEGNYNDGYNLVNTGSRNLFRMADMANPHAGGFSLHNVLSVGLNNRFYGPYVADATYGDNIYDVGNWINDDPTLGAWTPAAAGCGTGSNPTFTVNDSMHTRQGRVIGVHMKITVSAANSCAGSLTLSGLPLASSASYLFTIPGINQTTGALIQCMVAPNTSSIKILNASGGLTVVNADAYVCDGSYRTD